MKRVNKKRSSRSPLLFIFVTFLAVGIGIFYFQSVFLKLFSASAATPSLPIPLNVLVLEYFPRDLNDSELLDGVETGWGQEATSDGRTIGFWEEKTQEMVDTAIPFLTDSTRYHGYKDASAPAFLTFNVVDTRKFYTPIPRGYTLKTNPDGTTIHRPHYKQILTDINICDYVDNQNVKEVWMYGYHGGQIEPDESKMSSRHGDVSNGFPGETWIAEEFRMPRCENAFMLYNFTYQPGGGDAIGNNIHNRIHQIENMIPFVEDKWPPIREDEPNTNIPGSTFWGDFSEYVQDYSDTTRATSRSSCGNAHYTPNWSDTGSGNYNYSDPTPREFNCETWHPDDAQTTYILAGCERWGCSDMGFYKWFMQNIPGYNNGIVHNGQQMRNWWEAFYDFDKFIDQGRTVYGGSIFDVPSPTPTPTSVPTATPTPTMTPTPTPIVATFLPTDDSYVNSSSKKTTYGTSTTIRSDNNPVNSVYLKFDLSSLLGKTLISSRLRLTTGSDTSPNTQNVRGVNDITWLEGTLNYNNRPNISSSNLGTFVGSSANTQYSVSVTSYIASKMGQKVSFGVVNSGSDLLIIQSKESASDPILEVTYR